MFRVGGYLLSCFFCLHKPFSVSLLPAHASHCELHSQYKIMQKHPVVIHQSPQNQSSHRSAISPSTMERRPTYEAIKADPSTLKPRNRTISSASSSSSSSSSSTSLSRRKLIRDRYKRPWQLMSVITLHQEEMPRGRSGGLKSPYPTPGRRNYDRV